MTGPKSKERQRNKKKNKTKPDFDAQVECSSGQKGWEFNKINKVKFKRKKGNVIFKYTFYS